MSDEACERGSAGNLPAPVGNLPTQCGKSRSRNLTFVPEHNVFILELSTTNNRPELWTYRYKKAGEVKRPTAPTNLEVVTSESGVAASRESAAISPDSLRRSAEAPLRESGRATLTWTASTSPDVKEYHVYRAEPALPWLAEFKKVGTTSTMTFENKEVAVGKSYFYFVKAIARDGIESGPSFRARTEPAVLLKPTVSVLATNRLEIRWNAHPANDIAGYNLSATYPAGRETKTSLNDAVTQKANEGITRLNVTNPSAQS